MFNTSTESVPIVQIAKSWIRQCSAHAACQLYPGSSFVPTRLIYIGSSNKSVVKLIETLESPRSNQPQYMALSHCWSDEAGAVLTTANHKSMRDRIPVESLSRSFGDAISFTRALGVRYLWIESLCVLQDSPEDWARESVLMMNVFSNAMCTIATSSISHSEDECIPDRFDELSSCTLISSKRKRLQMTSGRPRPFLKDLFGTRGGLMPFTDRAWVFQERLLSHRVIHFYSNAMLFECNTIQASDTNVDGCRYENVPYILLKEETQNSSLLSGQKRSGSIKGKWKRVNVTDAEELDHKVLGNLSRDEVKDHTATRGIRSILDAILLFNAESDLSLKQKLDFNKQWYKLVSLYSGMRLKRQSDKLIAIAGIARLVEKSTSASYKAGLWDNVLPEFGLLWRAMSLARGQSSYCAPSWSWASAGCDVSLLPFIHPGEVDAIFHAHIQRLVSTFKGEAVQSAASHVDGGFMEITGLVTKVYASQIPNMLCFHRGEASEDIDYFPDRYDYIADSLIAPPEPAHGISDLSQVQLTALLVLSSPGQDGILWNADGLILRPKPNLQSPGAFERIGAFRFQGLKSYLQRATTEGWTQQAIRLY